MKIFFTRFKYSTILWLLTAICLLSIWWFKTPIIGLPALIIYLTLAGNQIGKLINPRWPRHWQIYFGAICFLCLAIATLTGIYWFYQINQIIISLFLLLTPVTLLFLPNNTNISPPPTTIKSTSLYSKLVLYLSLIFNLILVVTLLLRRYGDTLISPWTIIGPKFFLLFFITSTLLVWLLQKNFPTKINWALLTIYYGLFFSVTLIIFKYGFGFDQFIHQATEKWIALNGAIYPKQPYYLGQYVLTVFFYTTTHLSIELIDKLLTPLTTILFLPAFIYYCFTRANLNKKILPAILILPIVLLTNFTFTTPFNLALLISFFVFLWLLQEKIPPSFARESYGGQSKQSNPLIGSILCLTTLCIHPLVGLPVTLIYLGSWLIELNQLNQTKKKIISIGFFLILILFLPAVLYFNAHQNNTSFNLVNPLENLNYFFRIFAPPYWYWFKGAPYLWQLLYVVKLALIPIIILVSIYQLIISSKKPHLKNLANFTLLTTFGLLFSSFITATTIHLPNIISYEQSDFPTRILKIIFLLLLPFFLLAIQNLFIWLEKKNILNKLIITCLISSILTFAFYFTYPTRDPVSRYTGFAVRDADVEAVKFIDDRNHGVKDYLVLSNQTVAAAAVKEFGFAKYFTTTQGEQYFYSIPTGGPFYQYFRQMVYEQPKKQWMIQAMEFAGVKKAYFVHTNYWAPAAQIRDSAKLEADQWWELAGGRVWVYEYIRQ